MEGSEQPRIVVRVLEGRIGVDQKYGDFVVDIRPDQIRIDVSDCLSKQEIGALVAEEVRQLWHQDRLALRAMDLQNPISDSQPA